jgi:hypothetical protein
MPLVFDDRHLLPHGIHDATLEEVAHHFGRFQRNDRRSILVQRLREYVGAVQQARIKGSLIVDGSFVMLGIDEPDDLDLVLVLSEDWDLTAELQPHQYNVVSKRRVRQVFEADVFIVLKGSPEENKWVAFFSQVNPKWCEAFAWPVDATKGLVRISL